MSDAAAKPLHRWIFAAIGLLAISAVVWYTEHARLLPRAIRVGKWQSSSRLELSDYPSALSNAYIFATPSPRLDPYEVHPIHALMADAERRWKHKLATQSRTLAQVEAEYRRRYGIEPPPGLDRWLDYCQEHNVTLLDEYDSIMDDIRPFLAISGAKVLQRMQEITNATSTRHALLEVKDQVRMPWQGNTGRLDVSNAFEENIDELATYLPDVAIDIAVDDGPATFLDYRLRLASEEALRDGVELDDETLMSELNKDLLHTMRERMCPHDSNLHRYQDGLLQLDTRLPDGPSFIRNHFQATSFCNVPDVLPLNGFTSGLNWVADRLEPSWAMSHMQRLSGDVLWPPRILYKLNPPNEKPFREKTRHKAVWRGSPDGVAFDPWSGWRRSHRYRLVKLATSNETDDQRRLRLTADDKIGTEYQLDQYHSLAELNGRYLNIRATDAVHQGPDDFVALINQDFHYDKERMPLEEMSDHRYVVDVDGNAYSARFRAHLSSYQVPLKATVWNDWHQGRLMPWLHYVPIRQDYSDLYNIMAFFDGGFDEMRSGHHDDLAETIAHAGREWTEQYWRHEDMQAYLLRAMIEWARVCDPTRRNTKKLSKVPYW